MRNFSLIFIGSILLMSLFLLSMSCGTVPAGTRGVTLRFSAPTGEVKEPGLYFVFPFISRVVDMPVQVLKMVVTAEAASKDLQNVKTEVTLNFKLDAAKVVDIYSTMRKDYEDRIIFPAVQEAVKSSTAQFDAEKLITERPLVKERIESGLKGRLQMHGILLETVSITGFTFDEEFSKAIEQKVTATQLALKAQRDLERVKFEADQRIEQSKGEAEAIRIQCEAITKQGGKDYVSLKAVEKWNGALPTMMTGNGPLPILDLK